MSVTYQNAPLVEIIAEVRWGPAAEPFNAAGGFRVSLPRTKDEELLMHFGAEISAAGFGRIERLAPPGMPLPVAQVACRFRPTDPTKQSPLFQLGRGVFTSNAVPPDYSSWADFRPVVQTGLECLFRAHERSGEPRPHINMVLVRYIDAFGPDLTNGMEPLNFLREVMGLGLTLPSAISELVSDGATIRPSIQLSIPMQLGQMQLTFGPGVRENQEAMMLDTTLVIQRDIGDSCAAALSALTEARGAIHDLFLSLTARIHKAMKPS